MRENMKGGRMRRLREGMSKGHEKAVNKAMHRGMRVEGASNQRCGQGGGLYIPLGCSRTRQIWKVPMK